MNQSQPSTLSYGKNTGGLPEINFVYITNPSQTGNGAINGSTQMPNNAEHRRIGLFNDLKRNKPQSNSLAAASLIFTSAGMDLALSVGFGSFPIGSHIQICWFIAAIIGACISAVLAHHISNRIFNIVASGLVIINGVIYIAAGENTTAIVLARYCGGIAFGLILIPTILAGSEQSVQRFRGNFLSGEKLGLAGGGAILLILMSQEDLLSLSKWQGIISLIFGLTAIVLAFLLTLESPIFLLRKDNENEAVNVLRRLQKPTTIISDETYALLNENKALLEEDMTRGIPINISNSWIPMAKLILLRCFVTTSFFYPLTAVLLRAVIIKTLYTIASNYLFLFWVCIYMLMRLIGGVISSFFLDTIGRRKPSAIALIAKGGLLIAIACQDFNIMNKVGAQTAIYLLFIYQLLSGISAQASTCYLSEAFSVSVKPYFILTTIVAENVLQIITCCWMSKFSYTTFCYTLGGLQIVYGIVFFFTMPETKQTTLRKALEMFQSLFIVTD